MADKTFTYTIEIESENLQELSKLEAKVTSLKNAQKELKKNNQENTEQYQKNALELKKTQKALNDQRREILKNDKATKDAKGSINQLSAELAKNRQAYKALSAEERNNIDIGGKLLTTIQSQDKEIKKLDGSIGLAQRNVGDYTGALQTLPGPLGRAGGAVKQLGTAFKALIANPVVLVIGAIVGGLTLLYKAFTKNQKNADRLNKVFKAFSAIVAVIVDRVSNFATNIVKAFSNPKKAIEDLGKTLVNNIINRFKAIGGFIGAIAKAFKGDWKEAFELAKESAIELGTGLDAKQQEEFAKSVKGVAKEIKEEGQAASELESRLQKVEDREIAFITRREELNKIAQEALLKSRDQTASDEDRIKNLKIYLNTLDEIEKEELSIARERAKISQEQVDLGLSSREEIRANAELQAEVSRIQARNLQSQSRAVSLLTGLEKTLSAERTAASEKRAAELEKENEAYEAALDKEFELFEEEEQKKILAEINAEEQLNEKIQEIQDELDSNETVRIERKRQEEINAAKDLAKDLVNGEEIKAKAIDAINEKYNKLQELRTQERKRSELAALADVFGQAADLFKEQTIAYKVLAAAQASINTYLGATEALANPLLKFPLNIIAAGIIVTEGLINVAKIGGIKFARGGEIGGRPHSQGGTLIEAERGEVVINKNSASMFKDQLSYINQAGGGVPIGKSISRMAATGGLVTSTSGIGQSFVDVRALQSDQIEQLVGQTLDRINIVLPISEVNRVQKTVEVIETNSSL